MSDSGSIVIKNINDFYITLASHTTKERDRFTIAHELGHYFLHYIYQKYNKGMSFPSNAVFKAARYGTGRTETEANWFAASFLMPKNIFEKEFKSLNGSIFDLAERFGISYSACRIRAEELGLVN